MDAIITLNEKYKSDFAIRLSLTLLDYLEEKHRNGKYYDGDFTDILISHLERKKSEKEK